MFLQSPYLASMVALSCPTEEGRYNVAQVANITNSRFWNEVTDVTMGMHHSVIFFTPSIPKETPPQFLEFANKPVIIVARGEDTYFVIYDKSNIIWDFIQHHIMKKGTEKEIICLYDNGLYKKLVELYEDSNPMELMASDEADWLGEATYQILTQYLKAKKEVMELEKGDV